MSDADVKQVKSNWSTSRIAQIVLVLAVVAGLALLVRRVVATPSTPANIKPSAPAVGLAAAHTSALTQQPGFAAQNPPAVAAKAAREVLEQLKADPNNFALLAKAGNIYMYSRVFPGAAEYYEKALRVKEDAKVRNDYGNALFYSGEVDRALEQYEKILKADPKNADALFNRGMVRWRGKHDPKAAVESWKLLLKTSPEDPRRGAVEEMIAQAERHARATR